MPVIYVNLFSSGAEGIFVVSFSIELLANFEMTSRKSAILCINQLLHYHL